MSEGAKPKDTSDWVILKAEKDDQVSLCRLRKTRPPADFWTLVTIEWTYSDPEHSFPGPDLQQKMMNHFEDSIADLMEKEGASWLAFVITGLGLKEWSFYSSDFRQFIREFKDGIEKAVGRAPVWNDQKSDESGYFLMKGKKKVAVEMSLTVIATT
ncbi:MAG: DUF695 domain-containing protein [Blastocatellia bacterium]